MDRSTRVRVDGRISGRGLTLLPIKSCTPQRSINRNVELTTCFHPSIRQFQLNSRKCCPRFEIFQSFYFLLFFFSFFFSLMACSVQGGRSSDVNGSSLGPGRHHRLRCRRSQTHTNRICWQRCSWLIQVNQIKPIKSIFNRM